MVKRKAVPRPGPEARFLLALAFLIWSLLPHSTLVVHRHAESADGHRHAVLTVEEAALAERLASALAASGEAPVLEPFGLEARDTGPAGPAGPSLRTGGDEAAHGHYLEDYNLSGVPSAAAAPTHRRPGEGLLPTAPSAPDLPLISAASARGPPAFPSPAA